MKRHTWTSVAIIAFYNLLCMELVLAQEVKANLLTPPTFFTCQANNPPLPPGTPAGFQMSIDRTKQNECQGGSISGRYMGAKFSSTTGSVPQGKFFHQIVSVAFILGRTEPTSQDCGDKKYRGAFHIVEYFSNPAVDNQVWAGCCELTRQETVKNVTALIDQLPGTQPTITNFNAGLPYTTPAQRKVAKNNINNASNVHWGYTYKHDSCNPPARAHELTPWKDKKVTQGGRTFWQSQQIYSTYHD